MASVLSHIQITRKTPSPIGRIIHISSFKIPGIEGKAGSYELMLTAADSERVGQGRTHFSPSRLINSLFLYHCIYHPGGNIGEEPLIWEHNT